MIARRAGRVVWLGMLFGVISGCGTSLDPRLQSNAELRANCTLNDNTYSDEQIRGILALIEDRRLRGATKDEQYDAAFPECDDQYQKAADVNQCYGCRNGCISQVYGR